MASSDITPEYRQHLVDWRYRFTQYATSGGQFDRIPNGGSSDSVQVKS